MHTCIVNGSNRGDGGMIVVIVVLNYKLQL